ncbi:universal stress protein [Actinoplanes sp. NPDC049316]|uniref:universal stress protein n=1 Tax=Actinoplanes sp. NPDC049316 TaxID=3154727 RepID=UPI0034229CBD
MTARSIIVGYDRSPAAEAAAVWALDEAARTGAPVQFLYAYEPVAGVPTPAGWLEGETDRAVQDALRDAVTSAATTHPGVHIETSVVHASAATTLIERSAEAGLVVVGSRGHSAVANLLGSVSLAVSAQAHCPVVVVRGDPARTGSIVVGVDESTSAQLALGFAAETAAARGSELLVVRARPPLRGFWVEKPEVVQAALNVLARQLEDVLAPWRDKYPQVPVRTEVLAEHPAAALTRYGTSAQLVVVGSRGRGALRGMVLGSISQHLLHHAPCSVAVVHDRIEA